MFPQEPVREAFLNHVASALANNTEHPVTKKPYTFGANSGGVAFTVFGTDIPYGPRNNTFQAGEAFIHPIEKSSDGTVYYQAMEMNEFGGVRPVRTKDGKPMYFTSREPYLNDMRKQLSLQESAESEVMTRLITSQKAREVEQGVIEGAPALGRSLIESDPALTEALMSRRNQ